MIIVKSSREIDLMRTASKIVAEIHVRLKEKLAPGITTLDLDRLAEEWTKELGSVPAFKGYRGYQHTLCISVNEVVVHGIPSEKKVLKEGDIVGLDMGVIYKGWYGDAARTWAVGKVTDDAVRLMEATEKSLMAGIEQVRPGATTGDIGAAVQAVAEPHGYGMVEDYTGHGIGTAMHEPPYVPNIAPQGPGRGMELEPGIVLAIEPMLTLGSAEVTELDDGWTVVTVDGRAAAHWEHTVAVTPDGPWVLTALDGGVAGLTQPARLDPGVARA